MTLEEIEQTLPNGLHDSRITRIVLDYVERELRLDLEISFSDSDKDGSEIWRRATLLFAPFLYCVIEPPDGDYAFATKNSLWVDAGSEDLVNRSAKLPEQLPNGAFRCWFFVHDWNSFIYLAALDAKITFHDALRTS